jgi:hypothetical protein
MNRRIGLCKAALLLVSMPCVGAEFFYMDHNPFTNEYVGPTGPLVISGEIVPGDYDRLLSRILEDEDRFLSQNKIILASDGGDVGEALKIAQLVQSLFTEVIVGPLTGRCVSACFFIYAAANQRGTDGERLIGINRPYITNSEAVSAPGAAIAESVALARVRAFLRENAVPNYLIDEMFRRASDDAYWLSTDDEKTLGYRSPAFARYLIKKCAWDDDVERAVYAGKRPMDELKQMMKCRSRVTQDAARQALVPVSKERVARGTGR